jgi:hypothetical protein
MSRKPYIYDPSIKFICTVCGIDLKPKESERKQIRWHNKNMGVCQSCVIRLRSVFKPQSNKVPLKFKKTDQGDHSINSL